MCVPITLDFLYLCDLKIKKHKILIIILSSVVYVLLFNLLWKNSFKDEMKMFISDSKKGENII